MMETLQNGDPLEVYLEKGFIKQGIFHFKHPGVPNYLFTKKTEQNFIDELVIFQTNTIRQVCQ
jgi:hypothetical protein